jgi:hypothetical protein
VRPTLGVGFGTGNRAKITGKNDYCAAPPCNPTTNPTTPFVNRFYFVVDSNQTKTATEDDLRNITPPTGGVTSGGAGAGSADTGCANYTATTPCTGFFLDFATYDEKTTSTVFSTGGFLTLITFTATAGPCSTDGISYRYRFFFLNGQGGYNVGSPTNTFADYREDLGTGLASASQSTSPQGATIDTVLFSAGAIKQEHKKSSTSTVNVNWKEQQ